MPSWKFSLLLALVLFSSPIHAVDISSAQQRADTSDEQLARWLSNMLLDHRFSLEEVRSVTGLSEQQLREATSRLLKIDLDRLPPPAVPAVDKPLRILPYPGGRHPRIGFLDGAVDPQRETKFSAFLPWDPSGYVVVDLPEAVWSNLGLTYLAHTHVPTIWSQQEVTLEQLEWNVAPDGSLSLERRLPNGISFKTWAKPTPTEVRMGMSLTNDTHQPLSDLRIQMCAMLKGAPGFAQLTNDNKLFLPPLAAVHDGSKSRWIITGWQPIHRTWGNTKCPCLHADPRIPDCPPGETREVLGWLSFYQGTDIYGELSRIYRTNWSTTQNLR